MSLDASKVGPVEDSNVYDFVANTFVDLGSGTTFAPQREHDR